MLRTLFSARLAIRLLCWRHLTLLATSGICLLYSCIGQAKSLTLATSFSIPPYILRQSDSGVQLEIVREALAQHGHEIENIIYASNKRVQRLLSLKLVDMIINAPPGIEKAFYSDNIIDYQNVAITLKSAGIKLEHIDDLARFRVVAFQNARQFFGKKFAKMAEENKKYSEVINQVVQVDQLYRGVADVAISDKWIFLYYRKQLSHKMALQQPLTFHPIFPDSARPAAFYQEALRNDFNLGLEKLRSSGRYQELLESYSRRYGLDFK
ncbi:substrate-binding periplasmic protein [Dongshaea marina]|uniref:substrate-binding periplasmic protein n=1 Tax=Dongshaea marina TaxID=2047966 RepID=UPI000D3EB84C|nr:transporter substrate-binding domain-containing protein [Dongshaea marina]